MFFSLTKTYYSSKMNVDLDSALFLYNVFKIIIKNLI